MHRRLVLLSLVLVGCLAASHAQRFDVRHFGADGDADHLTLVTRSIQAAIDSASAFYAATGRPSTVVFEPGTYLSGTLYLKSGVTLQLDSGAVLLGSTNIFDYVKDTTCRLMAFIFAVDQHHIGITGSGTIDGQGFAVANNAVNAVHLGLLTDPLKYDRCHEGNRPQLIHFRECQHITVSQVHLANPANWCQEYDRCRHLLIDGISVDAKCYWNNDGLDIVDCQEVVVRNCFIDASDDAYCFKSHSVDGLSENILVEHCTGRSSANGIKFGTVTRGTFRHIRFRNITIFDTYRSAITIASVDGGHIEDIEVDGLIAINTGNPIFLRFSSRNRGKVEPCVKDIVIKNLCAEVPFSKPDAGYSYEGPFEDLPRNISPSSIVGTPGLRIQNVRLENVHIHYPGLADSTYAYRGHSPADLAAIEEWERRYPEFSMWKELPAWGFYIRHADGVTFDDVHLMLDNADYRPAIVMDDVHRATFSQLHLYGPLSKSAPRMVANNCSAVSGYKHIRRQQSKHAESSSQPLTSDQILAQDNASPCTAQGRIYKASYFGCKSDGITFNTSSIQCAIDHIAQQGGGTLVFEVGRYLTGTLQLREGVDIQLNEGALLVASPNQYDLDQSPAGQPILLRTAAAVTRICGLGRIFINDTIQLLDDDTRCQVMVEY